jgi:dTDP-4-dehydrorhamnose reductase
VSADAAAALVLVTRILVTGAAGALGSYVPQVFGDEELTLADRQTLDVTDREAVAQAARGVRPEVILHLAALTDVDACEQRPEDAHATNALGTENVALAAREVGSTVVFTSSAAVFDGDKAEPYVESDEPRPANEYGRSKLAGERSLERLVERRYVVRAGWLIGGGALDRKFVGQIVELILRGERHLRAVDDKLGSPTYALDLLRGIRQLLETEAYGLYHMVNPEPATRYEIALAVADALGVPGVEVEPVSSDAFPLPAPRGRSEAMRNARLEELGLDLMPPWRGRLSHYLHEELLPAMRA